MVQSALEKARKLGIDDLVEIAKNEADPVAKAIYTTGAAIVQALTKVETRLSSK